MQAAKQTVATVFSQFAQHQPELAVRGQALLSESAPCSDHRSGATEEAQRLSNLAISAAQNGDLARALQLFEQSVDVQPTAIAYKGMADVATAMGDTAQRTKMLRKAAQIVQKKDQQVTQLGQMIVVLGAWHNDLSIRSKFKEAAKLRPKLSALLKAQSTTAGFDNQCVVCLDEFSDQEGCWVVQTCRHLLHSECLKDCARVVPQLGVCPACPVCRQPMGQNELARLFSGMKND